MKISELIQKVQEEKPNTFTDEKVLTFVNEVEADVSEQLRLIEPKQYTSDDMETELLVPSPYDRLYVSYLKAQIDYANEEYDSYQNNAAQHVQDFRDYVDWVIRTRQVEETQRSPRRFRHVF